LHVGAELVAREALNAVVLGAREVEEGHLRCVFVVRPELVLLHSLGLLEAEVQREASGGERANDVTVGAARQPVVLRVELHHTARERKVVDVSGVILMCDRESGWKANGVEVSAHGTIIGVCRHVEVVHEPNVVVLILDKVQSNCVLLLVPNVGR
jgi:hypothetical protein